MTASSGRVGATFRKFLPLVGIAAFSVAVYLIYRALRRYNLADIIDSVSRIGVENMVLGVCFPAGSYLTLTWRSEERPVGKAAVSVDRVGRRIIQKKNH